MSLSYRRYLFILLLSQPAVFHLDEKGKSEFSPMLRACYNYLFFKSTASPSSFIHTDDELDSVNAAPNNPPIRLDTGQLLRS